MSRSYTTFALADLLDVFASNAPVPGGGSAAALAGSIGVSLLMMVTSNPKTRTGAEEEVADLAEAGARLRPLRDTLTALVDQDSAAYAAVIAAMQMPKATDADKAARRQAIDLAMREATEVPMDTIRACQQALRGATIVARHGNPNTASDTGTAIELLMAAIRGAGMNVEINTRSLSDAPFIERVAAERTQLVRDAESDASEALAMCNLR